MQSERNSFLGEYSYKKPRVPADVMTIMEKDNDEFSYSFSGTAYTYDGFKVTYHFGLGINAVVEFLRTIHEHTPLRKGPVLIPKQIAGISPGLLKTPDDPWRSFKIIKTGEELAALLTEIKLFYNNEFAAFCAQYTDIKALDHQFNNLDAFYEKGVGVFPGLSFLSVTRLVIARLANNPNYETVVERNFEVVEKDWIKHGGAYDRRDEKMPEIFAAKYLRDIPV